MLEMVSRVLKNLLREKLRKRVKVLKVPLEEPYQKMVFKYLNRIFEKDRGEGKEKTNELWEKLIPEKLVKDFFLPRSLLAEIDVKSLIFSHQFIKKKVSRDSRKTIEIKLDGKYMLLERLSEIAGLTFRKDTLDDFQANPHLFDLQGSIFDRSDFTLREKVKHMSFVMYAEGYLHLTKGLSIEKYQGESVKAVRYFREALKCFEIALNSTPNDPLLLRNIARVLHRIEKSYVQIERKKRIRPEPLSLDSSYLSRANIYFKRALEAAPSAFLLTEYACFLEDCHEYSLAEDKFLCSLLQNPNQPNCLKRYGSFLQDIKKDSVTAEKFFLRLVDVQKKIESFKHRDRKDSQERPFVISHQPSIIQKLKKNN